MSKNIEVPKYIFNNMCEAIMLAHRILESRKKETATDRLINKAYNQSQEIINKNKPSDNE